MTEKMTQKREAPNIEKAMQQIRRAQKALDQQFPIDFRSFLEIVTQTPDRMIRNVFQYFHDMVKAYVGTGVDEYPDDPESIKYVDYDCTRLFVENSDHPFLADRLFANRFVKQVESMRQGQAVFRICLNASQGFELRFHDIAGRIVTQVRGQGIEGAMQHVSIALPGCGVFFAELTDGSFRQIRRLVAW